MTHDQRNYLSQYLNIIDANTNEFIGYLGDVSDQGIMFITNEPQPADTIKDIIIQNHIVSETLPYLSVKAKIKTLWVKPNLNPEMLCIGCSLLEIDASERQELEKLVASLKFGKEVEIHRTVAIS